MVVYGNAVVAIHDSIVEFNNATETGGGLRLRNNVEGRLTYLRLANNTAGQGGGGFSVTDNAQVRDQVICPVFLTAVLCQFHASLV
jgi:hypothetical protein